MGRFSRAIKEAAKAGNASGNWLPCLLAKYKVKLAEVKAVDRFGGGLSFVVEFEILEILAKPRELKDAQGYEMPEVGMTRSYVVNLDEGWKARSMIEFLGVACGEDLPEDEDEQEACVEECTGSEQPLAGLIMTVETTPTRTTSAKAKSEWWTKYDWHLVG